MTPRIVKTDMPPDGIFSLSARLHAEGRKSLAINVPKRVVRGLGHTGWGHGWLGVSLGDSPEFFAYARVRSCLDFAVPKYLSDGFSKGDIVPVRLRAANHLRAAPQGFVLADGSFDWAAAVPPGHLAIPTGNLLTIHNRRGEPFSMTRRTPREVTAWLLGAYQSCGALSPRAPGWSASFKGYVLALGFVESLSRLGISHERIYGELSRETDASAYAGLGVELRRGTRKGSTIKLMVRQSRVFARMTQMAINLKADAERPDPQTEARPSEQLGDLSS